VRHAQKRGITRSGIMHFLMLLVAIFGLPRLLDRSRIEEPQAITVEILPITGITNVKPQEAAPEPKPEEKPAEVKQPEPPKPQPKVQTEPEPEKPQPKVVEEAPPPPEPKPDEKKPEEKPVDPKPAEKPPEKKPEEKKAEKKPKKPEEDLMAVLKSVKETAQKEAQKEDETTPSKEETSENTKKALSNQYNPGLPLSMSEKDAIRSQIAKCWNVPAGAKDAHELIVIVRVQLEQDGTVINVELAGESKSRYASDTFFRAAADSAIRAVRQCSPLENLPPDKFQTWRDIELTFDPKEMLF